MTANPHNPPWLGPEYFENRHNFPLEELAKFAGKFVAFSWDGSRIVASGSDEEELENNLVAAGIDSNRVVYSYVDDL